MWEVKQAVLPGRPWWCRCTAKQVGTAWRKLQLVERRPWWRRLSGTCGLGETHARAVHSWRTALCGINQCWSSSWRTAAHEKDPYWSSSWRTASFGKNHAGECNRMREKQQQRQHHRLTVTPFNIPLHCLGWGTRWKSGVKKSLERGRGGEKLCLFLIFCFILYFSLLFLSIALMLIDNKLIFSKLGLEEILTLI